MKDSLGWPHFKISHTGPCGVCVPLDFTAQHLRCMTLHVVSEGKTLITDGEPDWSTSFLMNAFYYMRPIKCNDHFASDHEKVHKFLKAPLKEFRDGFTHTVLLNQIKFLLGHIRRHHNEITFLKCKDSACSHCTNNPVRAKEVYSFLEDRKMKLFYLMPSDDHQGHYSTFLEMCNKRASDLPETDTHLPSYDSSLGHCPHCPNLSPCQRLEKKTF